MNGFMFSLMVSICVCWYVSAVFHVYDKCKSTYLPMIMITVPATIAIVQACRTLGVAG